MTIAYNRTERRAIAHGRGRNTPMVEIEDIESAYDYAMSLPVWVGVCQFDRLFIEWQVDYDWVLDDWNQTTH